MAGQFTTVTDAPEFIKIEGETINVKVKWGIPASGQATIEWNIPQPAGGCIAGEGNYGAYCGMMFVISESLITPDNYPTDGTYYHDDPTANPSVHTGDKIGGALVVGSFWERETKAANGDMTTSFVVSDIDPNKAYYVAGFALDCQLHYHTEGKRAYSDTLGNNTEDDSTPAYQNITLGADGNGVLPTDATGLVPGRIYQFDVVYDPTFPTGAEHITHTVEIDGINAGTFQDLLDQINQSFASAENPYKAQTPPMYGTFYWNATEQKLYQFNGTTYDEITNVLVEATDPAQVTDGEYWYNPVTGELKIYSATSPVGWSIVTYITSAVDPRTPECDQYWFDGSTGYIWNGSAWVELTTIVSTECPTNPETLECGSYWYDTTNEIMYKWDHLRNDWEATDAIYWPTDPSSPSHGDYWFNLVSETLNEWRTSPGDWVNITADPGVYVQEIEPTLPDDGALWYQISEESLKQWDDGDSEWDEVPVISWDTPPDDTESNDLWWNSSNDVLSQWDVPNDDWAPVVAFYNQATDPRLDKSVEVDTVWFDTEANKMYRWDGEVWIEVDVLISTTDPTDPQMGDIYYNSTEEQWYIYSTTWEEFDPIDSINDPTSIPTGTYWMNTTNDVLSVRNGLQWLEVVYTTTPYSHSVYDTWLKTTDCNTGSTLYEWNGTEWVLSQPLFTASFGNFVKDGCKYGGGIRIETTKKGSSTILFIPTLHDSDSAGPGCVTSGYADFEATAVRGGYKCQFYSGTGTGTCGYPARVIEEKDFLWSQLGETCGDLVPGTILQPVEGMDAPHDMPGYDVIGVGTDGTPDERRELIDSIRRQLGYPTVAVELTHYQLDTAIQGALESYRKRVSASTKRGFYFLDIVPGQQRYYMTNQRIGYDKIVEVMTAYRFTSAFLTQAHAAGHYGQIVLQHLYNMGTYDLLSYDLVNQYINQLEISFASRLNFKWDEEKRTLDFYASFVRPERIIIDVSVERYEQDILKDRYAKSWIERYAIMEAMIMLAQIRGKYGSLPGAGGGITLNSEQLFSQAQTYREELIQQVDDFVIERPEDFGMASSFVFG